MQPQHKNNLPRHEFDTFIDQYRSKQDQHVSLSGESGAFFAHYRTENLYEWFPAYRDKAISILDFGCGDELMTEFVHQAFPQAETFGINSSAKSIEEAQKNFTTPHFSWFNGASTPFASKKNPPTFVIASIMHQQANLVTTYIAVSSSTINQGTV